MYNIYNQNFDTALLLVCAVVACVFLAYWHLDKSSEFDVRDLLIDKRTKRLSLNKIGQFFALLVSTWVLIYETRSGRLTEWLFIAYMIAWSGTNLANKYLDKQKSQDPPQ
jgi:hypothetical protein